MNISIPLQSVDKLAVFNLGQTTDFEEKTEVLRDNPYLAQFLPLCN